MNNDQIKVIFAEEEHTKYAEQIVTLIYESALQRGTGIARRTPEYIAQKIRGGKAGDEAQFPDGLQTGDFFRTY